MKRQTHASKGQGMRSVLLYVRRMPGSGPQWTRVRNLVLTIGLAMLVTGVIGVRYGRAQATDQNCSSDPSSPDACAPNGNAEAPSAGVNSQGTERNCSSDPASPEACAPSGSTGDAQAPSRDGAQGTDQACGAESSPEACGPNGEADTASPSEAEEPGSAGEAAGGSQYTVDEQKCIQACGGSSGSESCLRNCAQQSMGNAPPQNAGAQGPPTSNSRQPKGAPATPAGCAFPETSKRAAGGSGTQSLQESAITLRSIHADPSLRRKTAALRQRRFPCWHGECERTADGSSGRRRLRSRAGR